MFVGVGAARVRDLFAQAGEKSPCIIFIDELDALGRSRAAGGPMGGANDEKEQTLNQLLSELDGFDTREGVVLLAATNRPEILDPALLRSGRFDRQILVDRPDRLGRLAILKVHARHIILAPAVDLDAVAALTPGFTGADLANLINEAALLATRRSAPAVESDHITMALERIIAGLEKKNRLLNPVERRSVAFHEFGHALVSAALSQTERIHKISILPRGIGALGYTIQRPTEDRYLMTRAELESKLAVLMGGRAAEALIFKQTSTGAADDIARATDIARSMVMSYGMEERLGPVAYGGSATVPLLNQNRVMPGEISSHGEKTQTEIDESVRALIRNAFERATQVLRANQSLLDQGAEALLREETLLEPALKALFAKIKATPEPT
jgi:cell division protease FtsH